MKVVLFHYIVAKKYNPLVLAKRGANLAQQVQKSVTVR